MEFPKYDSVGNPLPWLNRCERYFRVRRTLENRHVAYAPFYLTDDTQLWYHQLELNVGPRPWPCFVQLVNKQFGLSLTDNPISELALLRHDGSVDDFAKCFMALSCRDTAITEAHQVQLFLVGLGKPLRIDVALHRPPHSTTSSCWRGHMNSARRRRHLYFRWHLDNSHRCVHCPSRRALPRVPHQPRQRHHRPPWPSPHPRSNGLPLLRWLNVAKTINAFT
jgi:hypothetical protein